MSVNSGVETRIGWVTALVGDLCDFIRGVSYDKAAATYKPSSGHVAVLRAGNLQQGEISWDDLVYVPKDYVHETQRLRAGDIIVAMSSGSASLVGKAATVREHHPNTSLGAFCGLLRPRALELAPWLSIFFQSDLYLSSIRGQASGTNINNLRRAHFSLLQVPVPPLGEQHRIIKLVESLQASSRRVRGELETIPPLLEKLRYSFLTLAFNGDLTADWRERNPNVEPASKLLERIRTERRRRWEEDEIARMRAKKKLPKDEKWKTRYREPMEVDDPSLPRLPQSWTWTNLDTIALLRPGLTKGKRRSLGERLRSVPYLRVANVQRGYLDLREVLKVQATEAEIADLRLERGDILFNEGGDRDKLGRGWVWEGQIPECIHQNHVFRARLIDRGILPELLSQYANFHGQAYFFGQGRQTTNLASISLSSLASLPVPLIPSEEAQHISGTLAHIFARLRLLQDHVELALQELVEIDRRILDKAFRGELVSQDQSEASLELFIEQLKTSSLSQPKPKSAHRTRRTRMKQSKITPHCIPETHLRDTVKSNGGAMAPEALWRASDLAGDIDAFYAQLRLEVAIGLLREIRLDYSSRIIEVIR